MTGVFPNKSVPSDVIYVTSDISTLTDFLKIGFVGFIDRPRFQRLHQNNEVINAMFVLQYFDYTGVHQIASDRSEVGKENIPSRSPNKFSPNWTRFILTKQKTASQNYHCVVARVSMINARLLSYTLHFL